MTQTEQATPARSEQSRGQCSSWPWPTTAPPGSPTPCAHRAGRDLTLAAPIPDLAPSDQAIVACVVAFQRKKVRPKREPAFLWLGKQAQQTALDLAAILRLAGALDVEPSGGLHIQLDGDATTLILGGERAAELASCADERAALWRNRIGALTIRVAELDEIGSAEGAPPVRGAEPALELVLTVQFGPDHASGSPPLAEASRRMLRRFFDKLLSRENGVRKDKNPEDVHQMRVATRRLRASLQVVDGVYDSKLIRRYRRGLRRLARSLGGELSVGDLRDRWDRERDGTDEGCCRGPQRAGAWRIHGATGARGRCAGRVADPSGPGAVGPWPTAVRVLPSRVELEIVRVIDTPQGTHIRYRVRR